jgi:hypothetical protein
MKVTFNTNLERRARKASEKAAKAVFAELNGRFQDAMGAKVWQWPRVTMRGRTYRRDGSRSKGKPVGSPRNIVDSENLKGSNKGPKISGLNVEYRWSTRYARAVHNGALIYPWGNKKAKKVLLPARPWTSAVLGTVKVSGIEPYDMGTRFSEVWLVYFKKS